jgi:hypothetical protein
VKWLVAALAAAGVLGLSLPASASTMDSTFAGGSSRVGLVIEMQSTITVPSSVQAGGEAQVSAWVMDSNADTGATDVGYRQAGWIWESSDNAFHIYSESGVGSGGNVSSFTRWVGPAVAPGSTVTEAVDCNPYSQLVSTWYYTSGGWTQAGPNLTQPGLCVPGTWWSRMTEIDAPAGTPVTYTPVDFTGGAEIRDWSGRLLSYIYGAEALSPAAP